MNDLWNAPETGEHGPVINEAAKVPLRNGSWVQFEILRDTASLDAIADWAGLTVDELLEDAERWAMTDGFIYGITVDREKQTITQAGQA